MRTFEFRLYVSRFKSEFTYRLARTGTGWQLDYKVHSGPTKPDGSPLLLANFEQDGVSYPVGIGDYLEYIWGSLHSGKMSDDEAAEKIQQLGDWVSACEKSQPEWIGWNC